MERRSRLPGGGRRAEAAGFGKGRGPPSRGALTFWKQTYKRASVRCAGSRRYGGVTISLGPVSPPASCGLPGHRGPLARAAPAGRRKRCPAWPCSGRGMPSRGGHPPRWWALTPPLHPCPHRRRGLALGSARRPRPLAVCFCGTFPGSPRVGVTHRPALRRPDFPRPHRFRGAAAATRPASGWRV